MVLRITLGVVSIVAGIDKFTDLLVDWDMYVNPQIVFGAARVSLFN